MTSDLNDMQQKAANHLDGPLLILAGAGSGKTKVLTVRIAKLIERGVDPFNILAITFTNKAANEMKDRVEKLVGKDSKKLWISTFHSSCVRILRVNADKIGFDRSFNIYDSDDSEKLIKESMQDLRLDKESFHWKAVKKEISNCKDNLIDCDEYLKQSKGDFFRENVAEVYKLYQQKLFKSNAMDFDDLIFRTVQLLNTREDVLDAYQDRFKYVLVDEYQDTNFAQYQFVSLLSKKHQNICVVGDDDQSIYSFRGANIRNILEFEKDFPGALVVKLEQNYRSKSNILNVANEVIQNNLKRKSKKLWTENGEGNKIVCFVATDELDEANFVANTIIENQGKSILYSDMAILYRTNSQSRVLEDVFVRKSIPYRIFGGLRFYERREIKDILSYLKLLANPKDDLSAKRVINVPRRGIGTNSLEKLIDFANEYDVSLLDSAYHVEENAQLKSKVRAISSFTSLIDELKNDLENKSIEDIIKQVLELSGYMKELENEGNIEAKGRIENLEEFLAKGIEFDSNNEEVSLEAFLEEVALVADIDNYNTDSNSVTLMTIHSSKGLEFPTVFLVGVEENLFPSFMSMSSGKISDIEEERRLFYVGVTRAMEDLNISYAQSRMIHGRRNDNKASMFLAEISEDYLEFKKNENKLAFEKYKATPLKRPEIKAFKPYNMTKGIQSPKNIELDFTIGDDIMHHKYGIGEVLTIEKAGADYEVCIYFNGLGEKKFMAGLSKIRKA